VIQAVVFTTVPTLLEEVLTAAVAP